MTFGLPQIIFISLIALRFGMHLANHGQPTHCKYDAVGVFVASCIYFALLYWGGFFN